MRKELWNYETQYRVVGTTGERSVIVWVDTAEQAIELALCYEHGTVYRPDGSVVGHYYDRYARKAAL